MKKFLSGLMIGAFVLGLGAADMSSASAAKPEYGNRGGYDGRAHEFGLNTAEQFQNLAKPEYGNRGGYDGRAHEFGLGTTDQFQNLAKPEYGNRGGYDGR